jgi:hypothetical protein
MPTIADAAALLEDALPYVDNRPLAGEIEHFLELVSKKTD